jgi:hypothetical protein
VERAVGEHHRELGPTDASDIPRGRLSLGAHQAALRAPGPALILIGQPAGQVITTRLSLPLTQR